MNGISTLDPLRVLILDDDALDRMAAARALKQLEERPRFDEADSAAAAFAKLRAAPYDVVLIDYVLGDTTALDVVPSLRREFADSAIVVLTGHTEASIAVELMKAGATDFISKNELSPETLERSLRYAMRLKASERALATLEAERRHYHERLNDLVTGAASIVGELSVERVLAAAAERACAVLGAAQACVGFVDQAGSAHVHSHVVKEAAGEHAAFWSGVWEHHRDGRMPTIRTRRDDPELFPDGGRAQSLLIAPLPRREAVRAGIVGVSRNDDEPWRDSDVPLLMQVAQLTAVSLENARSYQLAERAVQTREEVLAVVSHDLRAPLSNLRLATTALREVVPPGSDAASIVTRMDRTTTHMTRLVDDLLEVSRLDAGTFRIEPRSESANALVEAAAQLGRPLAQAAEVELAVAHLTEDVRVLADRTRILQCLSNLLANAFKFTPRGGCVRLGVELTDSRVAFHVSDTGPGIAEEAIGHVFDRYWQAPTAQRSKGAGLGLYIAREVVTAHGGTIEVDSKRGVGTTFRFYLPRT